MPQAWIDKENAWRAGMEAAFVGGNNVLNDLIRALGGNPPSEVLPGDAGVPTSGPLGPGNWYNGLQLADWQASAAFTPTNTAVCVVPEVLPLVTVFPVPAAGPVPADANPPASGFDSRWLWGGGLVLGLLALAGGGRGRGR
jgi:hypothetical protein